MASRFDELKQAFIIDLPGAVLVSKIDAGVAGYRRFSTANRLCLLLVPVLMENLYVLTSPREHMFRTPLRNNLIPQTQ